MTMDLVSSVCVLPSSPLTSTLPGAAMRARAVESIDLVFLQQEVDALHVAVDTLILERHHGLEIEFGGERRSPSCLNVCPASSKSSERAKAPSRECSRY